MRILSVFGVIVIHAAIPGWWFKAEYTWNWQIMNMWYAIFRWPVPLFVMISGMFNIEKYNAGQPLKTGILKIAKKIGRIYCALIFWALFYKIFVPVISNYHLKEFIANPLSFLNIHKIIYYPYKAIGGDSWYHLWFLYMIIGLYLLTPLVKVFVSNCQKNYLIYFMLIVFLVGMGVPFYNFINTLKDIPLLPHKIHINAPELSGFIGYYIAGYFFSKYKLSKKIEYSIYALGIVSTAFTILGNSFISIKTGQNEKLLHPLAPNIMLETIALFLFVKNKFENIHFSVLFRNTIVNMSKCTFGIYLVHDFMIKFVNIYFGLHWNTFNPLISVPVICILVFLLSYLAAFTISKIPLLNKYVM